MDEFDFRTFAGNPNPPPDFSKVPAVTPAPATPEVAPVDVSAPAPSIDTERDSTAIAAASKGVYRVVDDGNGKKEVFLRTPGRTDSVKLGDVAIPDADAVLNQAGTYDPNGRTWEVPEGVAMSLVKGKQPLPEFIRQQYQAGDAIVLRGLWGKRFLSGESKYADAASHGNAERLKMVTNERPDIAWSEAPFSRSVAEMRWAAGEAAKLTPYMVGAAGESAQGAALFGGAAIGIGVLSLGTGGLATPAGITAVAGMMSTGASYNTFKYVMDIEGGNLALDMMEKGFDEKTVKTAAPAYGALSAAMELVGFKFLTAPMKRAVSRELFMSAPVKKILTSWYMNYAKELGAEVSVEVAQQATQDTVTNFAAIVDKRADLMVSKEEMLKAMGDTALASAAGLAIIKLPGVAMDFSASRGQKANVREIKTALAAGEMDAKTVSPTVLEKSIMGEEKGPVIEAKKINEILKSEKGSGTAAAKLFEFGKKNSESEDVKAALHAKAEALKIKLEAVTEGKPIADLTPEQQTEIIPLAQEMTAVNEMGKGIEEGIRLSAEKKTEPMLPIKEPKTTAEFVGRRFTEQEAVLRTLSKESSALDKELTNVNDDIVARMAEGKPTVALAAAADKIAAKIRENDAKGAEIVMTPMGAEEQLAQRLVASGAHATIPAAELVRMERDLVSRVEAARASSFKHGEAFAKREVTRVQQYVQELVKRSSLTAGQKSKFMAVMRNTQTIEQLDKNYPEIRDRIFEAEALNRGKVLDAILAKELKSGRVKKSPGGKVMGRFGDADTQAIVDTVSKVVKMTRSAAELELVAAEKELMDASDIGAENYSPEAHTRAEYKMRAAMYRAGQLSPRDSASFITDLVSMTEGAKVKFLEQKIAEREERLARQEKAIGEVLGDIVPPEGWERAKVESGSWVNGAKIPRGLVGIWSKAFDSLASLSDLLAWRSGKAKGTTEIEQLLRTDVADTKERGLFSHWGEKANAAMDSAYNFEGSERHKAFLRRKAERRLMEVHDLGVHENAAGQRVALKFSIDEAIKRYMEKQDITLADNFSKPEALAYTPKMEAEIFGLLNDGDRRFAAEQLKLYRELHKEVNTVYRKVRGVDLPFNEFYSPIRVLGYAEKEGMGVSHEESAYQVNAKSTLGGWGIARVKHSHPLEQLSSILTFNDHVKQLSHYIAWESKVREWNSLMVNPKFKAAVTGVYGSEVMDAMRLMVQRITTGTHERAIMRGMDAFITRLMSAGVVGKPIMIAKQLTSLPAFASGVPAEHLHLLLAEAVNTARQGFSKEWVNSDFVKSRGWNQFQELSAAHELGKKGGKIGSADVAEMMALPIKAGDKSAILLGGDALFRYLRSQGKSVAEAVEITSKIARETQSSGSLSDLSVFQAQSGLLRLFTAYRNQPIQFLRMEMSAFRAMASKGFGAGEGRMTRLDAAKTLFIYHLVIPMFFQGVADFGWDEEHQKRAMFFGSFNDLPAIGNLLSNLYHVFAKEEGAQLGGGDLMDSWTRDVTKAMKALSEAEDLEDYAKAFALLADPAFKAMWGIPTKVLVNMGTGISQIAQGDSEDFLSAAKLVAGYSPYMIEEQSRRN